MSVRLEALRPGFSILTVTYQYKDILLKAAITVGAYLPLQVCQLYLFCLIEMNPLKLACYAHSRQKKNPFSCLFSCFLLLKFFDFVNNVVFLQVLDPSTAAVVTVGSIKNIMLGGGPLPWILDTSGYYENSMQHLKYFVQGVHTSS